MKYFVPILLIVSTIVHDLQAQGLPTPGSFDRQTAVEVAIMPVYQRYSEDDQSLRQTSVPVQVFVPLGRQVAVSLQTSGASATGDDVASLSGLSDLQTSVSYARNVGEGTAVVTGGISVPSGKEKLTSDEFDTSLHVSRNFYDFSVPSLGQGFTGSAGVTWAHPIAERIVVGGGGSYLYKGAFQPLRGVDEEYQPGTEFLLTGGVDYKITEIASIAADVTHTRYARDTWGIRELRAGSTTSVFVQYLQYIRFDELRLRVAHRSRAKSELPFPGGADSRQQLLPTQTEVAGMYRHRFSDVFSVGAVTRLGLFGETVGASSKRLVDLGLLPVWVISERLSLQGRVIGTFGDISGVETAVGVSVHL